MQGLNTRDDNDYAIHERSKILECLRANPSLVIARISGWGQTGPCAQLPGFGTLVEAVSGFASVNGFADREPVLPPVKL